MTFLLQADISQAYATTGPTNNHLNPVCYSEND